MKRTVIRRDEMLDATLQLGGSPIALDEYVTTGLLAVAIGPRGNGKTNAGLLMAEQLSAQGWVSVLIDPENELESLYGDAVADPDALRATLATRDNSIVVVNARDAGEFVPYGRAILDTADEHRKPIFVVIDEGQLFSASRKRSNGIGEAADIINEFAERGRKRALDLFITALRYTGKGLSIATRTPLRRPSHACTLRSCASVRRSRSLSTSIRCASAAHGCA